MTFRIPAHRASNAMALLIVALILFGGVVNIVGVLMIWNICTLRHSIGQIEEHRPAAPIIIGRSV